MRPPVLLSRRFTHTTASQIFDLRTKGLQKARAALSPHASTYDYLRDEIATLVVDRLRDISRPLPNALDLFCGSGAHLLRANLAASNPASITTLTHTDLHPAILARAATFSHPSIAAPQFALPHEQAPIPLPPASLDAVLSAGALHWVNDLPLVLARVRALLKPDGLFLAAMLGGDTLHELRVALQLAEEGARGRVAPRVSPMVRLRDAAGLVSGAGLGLATVDVDRIVVPFKGMWAVMRHLKGMGESNGLVEREIYYGRDLFDRAERIYEDRFGFLGEGGVPCVPATFEVVHMIGWKKAEGQARPARRGSAQLSIKDLPGVVETIVPKEKDGGG